MCTCTRFFFTPYKDMRYEGSSWQDIEHLLAAVLNWLVTVNAKSLFVLVMNSLSYLCFSPFNGQVVMVVKWWYVVAVGGGGGGGGGGGCGIVCYYQPLQWPISIYRLALSLVQS